MGTQQTPCCTRVHGIHVFQFSVLRTYKIVKTTKCVAGLTDQTHAAITYNILPPGGKPLSGVLACDKPAESWMLSSNFIFSPVPVATQPLVLLFDRKLFSVSTWHYLSEQRGTAHQSQGQL